MPNMSAYDLNVMLPDSRYFEIYFHLDRGTVRALTSLRYQTFVRQGQVAPKGFTGTLMDFAKSSVMKRIYHSTEWCMIPWDELVERSIEFRGAGGTFEEGDV